MTKLTITAKGQVTLKQELLNHLGVGPGEKIEADKLPDGRIVVRAAAQGERSPISLAAWRKRMGRNSQLMK